MGIDDPYRLQIGIDDNCPHKLHAPSFHIFGNFIRQFRADPACLINNFPFRPVPEVALKAPPLMLDSPEYSGIVHGGSDFQFIADDTGILPQRRQLFLVVSADLLHIKIIESLPKRLPLVEDALPGKPRLKALQHQHFKQLMVVVNGDAPLLIVISDVKGILGISPAASDLFFHFAPAS